MTLAITEGRAVRRRWAFAAAVLVLGGLGGLAVLGKISENGKPPAAVRSASPAVAPGVAVVPLSLKAADGLITNVDVQAPMVWVKTDVKNARAPGEAVALTAMTAVQIGKALQRGVSEQLAGVTSIGLMVKSGDDPMMTIGLPVSELKAADYAKVKWPAVLDMANTVMISSPNGLLAVRTWCAGSVNAASRFCATALPK